MPYLTLLAFLLVVATLTSVLLVWAMSGQLLRPRRMTDGLAMGLMRRMSPEDLGLAFTPMGFTVRATDAGRTGPLRLAAWWVPAASPSERTAVLLHGYADAKVGGIAWAPLWHGLGWNVLALDLRGHGHSEGRHVTAGYFERDDLDQVLDALRAEKPGQTRDVAFFGVSLGAAVAAATAARRNDLYAVVMESPYVDYYTAVRRHGHRRGLPLEVLFGWVARMAEWRSGARFGAVRPVDLVRRVAAPVLVFHGDRDLFIRPADLEQFAAAMAAREVHSEHAVLPGVQHVLGLAADPAGYAGRLSGFLARCEAARAEAIVGIS